jgi:lipid II:glycine glycyltransferase (peptidoglycan interpeptide bridge formation enzyme)
MIYYNKKGIIKIAEIWYDVQEKPLKRVDVLRYKFVSKRPQKAASVEELYTLLLDLEESENSLFLRIRKNTRYEINRARNRDGIICFTLLTIGEKDKDKISQYLDFYNVFANSKGRSHISFNDVMPFYNNDTFCIRYAESEREHKILAMHAYIISNNTARLYQSSSHFRASDDGEYRAMIGRANRLLHWDDIIYFKAKNIKSYDFGGWYGGAETTGSYGEQLLINLFKESFGGEKKQEFSYVIPASFWGEIAVLARSGKILVKNISKFHPLHL